jgi:peroxiredoxin
LGLTSTIPAPLAPSDQEAACVVRGRVLDADDAPVAGARVLAGESSEATVSYSDSASAFALVPGIAREPPDRPHAAAETTTNGAGEFEIAGMKPGVYGLLVIAPAGNIGHALGVRPEAGETLVRVGPSHSISSRITGLPPWDASRYVISVEPADFQGNLKFVPRVTCGEGWNFEASGLPSIARWRVSITEWVLDGGFHATLFETEVDIDRDPHLLIDVSGGRAIEGVVLGPGDSPLAAVSVVASRPDEPTRRGAVTARDGRFRITGLTENADYQIEVSRHTMRQSIGCGFGPRDVLLSTNARAPSAEGGLTLRIAALENLLARGALAPDFTATTLDGASVQLSKLRGKVVLLDFWATWCVLCRAELAELLQLQHDHGSDGELAIVGVSLDRDIEAARRFVAGHGVSWPQIAEGPADRSPVAKQYNVCSTPSCFVIGRDGKILARDVAKEGLRAAVEKALASR